MIIYKTLVLSILALSFCYAQDTNKTLNNMLKDQGEYNKEIETEYLEYLKEDKISRSIFQQQENTYANWNELENYIIKSNNSKLKILYLKADYANALADALYEKDKELEQKYRQLIKKIESIEKSLEKK